MPTYIDGEQYDGCGWKFLTPYGSTIYEDKEFYYPLPQPGEKYGAWIAHPEPAEPDGNDCGPGRLHVMNKLSANYAPTHWWVWFCQYRGVIGQSEEKTGVRELRLRCVPRKVFWRYIRFGYCVMANLMGANLCRADLRSANLRGANLCRADLRSANLRGANLTDANLTDANLRSANLRGADLTGAYLMDANLRGADLSGADLSWAYLRGANLCRADLRSANLRGADLPDNWEDITTYHG